MCGTCGCGTGNSISIQKPGENSNHEHEYTHTHDGVEHTHSHSHNDFVHLHPHDHSHTIEVEKNILQFNDMGAARNRGYFEAKNIYTLNLVSSPGSGKTSFLEKTLSDLKTQLDFFVIEGDQQTLNDADRIDAIQIPVIQINTGTGCHLESDMVYDAVKKLDVRANSVLIIENVGNLVCPALFDLGENKRIVIISTTEGDDKPLKYPDMFAGSQVCIINKIDLLPYVNFKVEKAREYAARINPNLIFFEVSATTGEGMEKWYEWLNSELKK
jgi:hydrogenase nickel incorporation protein HypB